MGSWSGSRGPRPRSASPSGFARWRDGYGLGGRRDVRGDDRPRVEPSDEIAAAHPGGRVLVRLARRADPRDARASLGSSPRLRAAPTNARPQPSLSTARCDLSGRRVDARSPTEDGTPLRSATRLTARRRGGLHEQVQGRAGRGRPLRRRVPGRRAHCVLRVDEVAHIELNGHILIPLQNIASLHCTSRCDAPEPDWPPRGLAEDERGRSRRAPGAARPRGTC